MADLRIPFSIDNASGNALDADATPTIAVKRTDTNAVVVAAGTAMQRSSTGRYFYLVQDVIENITYEWTISATVSGDQITATDQTTIAPAMTLPSYLTVEQADALALGVFGLDNYDDADTDSRAKALQVATSRIESMRWQGRKVLPSQTLEFPRINADQYDARPVPCPQHYMDWDSAANAPVVPLHVRLACLLEANSILNGARAAAMAKAEKGLTSEAIGSSSKSYDLNALLTIASTRPICAEAMQLLEKFRLRSGRIL